MKTPEAWEGAWKRLGPYWGRRAGTAAEPRPRRLRRGSRGSAPADCNLHTPRTRGLGRSRPPTPGSQSSVGPDPNRARGPQPGAYHLRRHTAALPRSREWCGPAPPSMPTRGGASSRHVTWSDLTARRHGGFGPGSGALGSRRCRGDGGSRSRSGSSRGRGGGGRGSGSRSAARAPCTPSPSSARGAAFCAQDGRLVRGPRLRGQRPDHRGSFRGPGRWRDGAQPPATLREAAHPGGGPGCRREVGAAVKVTGRDLEVDGGRESVATDLGRGGRRKAW